MQFDKYEINASGSLLLFEFNSIGPKGTIKKQVEFKAFPNNPNVYNIGFGDVGENGKINDLVITGNEDSQKVLATVALTVFRFFDQYPSYYVYATGSTKARSRLYRMGISNNLDEISLSFEVFALFDNKWEKFVKDKNYDEFLIRPKR
jgi:hypothetical protein